MPPRQTPVTAALAVLVILQVTMLTSLFAGVAPHPPAVIPLGGMAPFLAASLSAAVAALILGPVETTAGRLLSAIAAVLALVSYGPQKLLDPAFPLVWPAVVTGLIAAATIAVVLIQSRATRDPKRALG